MHKKNGQKITMLFDKELLKKLDKFASSKGQTRTTCFEFIVREKLEKIK